MSPYYPTIDEDLRRAEEIIEKGRGNGEGETIYGADTHAAYKLLHSLTNHIHGLRQERESMLETIAELTRSRELAIRVNRRAAEQIAAAIEAQQEYAKRLATLLPTPPKRMGPLHPDHPSVHTKCPGCQRPIHPGDYVTLVSIGPGDDDEARVKAAAGLAYTAVAIVAHWACVTGQETRA